MTETCVEVSSLPFIIAVGKMPSTVEFILSIIWAKNGMCNNELVLCAWRYSELLHVLTQFPRQLWEVGTVVIIFG